MSLDMQRIAVRERGTLDLFDLATKVLRRHAATIAAAFLIGTIPTIAWNYVLYTAFPRVFTDESGGPQLYPRLLLFLLEYPLATAPLTLCLGQLLFQNRVDAGRAIRDYFGSLPQMALFQAFVRALLLIIPVTWIILFAIWPYMNEVILLERNPTFKRRKSPGLTAQKRISALHKGMTGDLFLRWLLSIGLYAALLASFCCSLWGLKGMFFNAWDWNEEILQGFFLEIAFWLTTGFACIVRYLSYLDLRTRREGWETEILLRSEGARLLNTLN